eukprot:492726_1
MILKPHHDGYVAFSVSSKIEIINVFMMELPNQIIKTAGIIQALSMSTPAIAFIGIHDVMVKINKMVILLFQYTGHVYLLYLLLLQQLSKHRIFLIFPWTEILWYKIVVIRIKNKTNGNISSSNSLSNYLYDLCCIHSLSIASIVMETRTIGYRCNKILDILFGVLNCKCT